MSSDVAGGPAVGQVRFEVAVGDFERFLLVGKSASTATRQCYVRHVRAMLAEVGDATGTIDLGRVSVAWVRSYVTRLGGRYAPVGFQNSVAARDQRFQAADSYWLISPPRTLVFRSFLALSLVRWSWGHAGDAWFVDASIRVKGRSEHFRS
jgi:hypothetical protein